MTDAVSRHQHAIHAIQNASLETHKLQLLKFSEPVALLSGQVFFLESAGLCLVFYSSNDGTGPKISVESF